MPPDMARKFAEGYWDVFSSQYFTQFENPPGRHVITKRVKDWHTRWISGDWGYFHPFCILWHSKDEHGRVTTYDELWGRNTNEDHLGKMIGERNRGAKLQSFPFSWDADSCSALRP